MKNVKPGVCGLCGVAVVQPDDVDVGVGWRNGHLFERKLKANQTKTTELFLVRVRCMTHKEASDPRFYDAKGNVVVHHEGMY